MSLVQKGKRFIKENSIFSIFFLVMVIYYIHNMFAIKPWYDELYTYYFFVSRGPVYSAIHWPVPNNHVFYSVLSAFLDYLGNSYIGLRGISLLAASANLVLLYKFAGKFMSNYLAAGCTFLYAAIWQVNNLSVQGRGYTLSIMFYLISLHCLYRICKEEAGKLTYLFFALSLTGGLYALISSTFWVIPVCITGGVILLFLKKYKTLWKLIGASVIAAAITFFLYLLIWLAIGSNLMSKDPANAYYGVYQVNIILKTPIEAMVTGMEYMLATPYIQGDARGYIVAELFDYLTGVFNLFYANAGSYLVVFCTVMGITALIVAIRNRGRNMAKWFVGIYFAVTVIMVPVMLIIQSVQPYYRVFTFLGVPVALLIVWAVQYLVHIGKKPEALAKISCGLLLLISVFFLTREGYNYQYADRENEIAEMFDEEAAQINTICYMDDYQKYVLKFHYGTDPVEVPMAEAEYVLLPKELHEESYTVPVWPTLYTYESTDFEYLADNFIMIKESKEYELYQRK